MIKDRLILGTAQFGLDYGISNSDGKIPQDETEKILDKAYEFGIRKLDTASAYGDAEKVIGNYLKKNKLKEFNITTKIYSKESSLEEHLELSLKNLEQNKISTLLFHSFETFLFYKTKIIDFYKRYHGRKFDHLGVSVYTLDEMESLLDEKYVNKIQLPFNLFDRSKEKKDLIRKLRLRGKSIEVRSIYLQGLFFLSPESLNTRLSSFRSTLKELRIISNKYEQKIQDIALRYVISKSYLDEIVFGINKLEHLDELIKVDFTPLNKDIIDDIENLHIENKLLLNPTRW